MSFLGPDLHLAFVLAHAAERYPDLAATELAGRCSPARLEALRWLVSEALGNATSYGGTAALLDIAVTERSLVIVVRDGGPGMRAHLVAHHRRAGRSDVDGIRRACEHAVTSRPSGGGGTGLGRILQKAMELGPSRLTITSGAGRVAWTFPTSTTWAIEQWDLAQSIGGTEIRLETTCA